MKAMILAAGRGERMRPLTDTTPKPLLKIAGQTLIEYHLRALVKAGITEIVINHAWLGEQLEQFLGDGSEYGASIQYSPEKQALETAGGIVQALPLLCSQDEQTPFIVINGDIFTDYSCTGLMQYPLTKQVHLVLVNNPPHHSQGDFFYRDHTVFNAAGPRGASKYTFSGIGLYHPDFFKKLNVSKQALGPLLRAAMDKQQVSGEVYQGQWFDIGTPERLASLDRQLSVSQSS